MSIEAYPRVTDWLTVEGERFVVRTGKVDIGQRISTALCRVVAGELGLAPEEIDVAPVTTAGSPDEGITSGSNSIEKSGRALRLASATLRAAVLSEASKRLESDALDLRDGLIVDRNSSRSLRLFEIAKELSPTLLIDRDATLANADPPSSGLARGIREMVDGSFKFIHDIVRPNMLHARTVRPPHRKARLENIDAKVVARIEGEGLSVVRDGSFAAVVGAEEFGVVRAAERLGLACAWDAAGGLDESDVFELLAKNPCISLRVEDATPTEAPLPEPLDQPDFTARYQRPYQLHGSLAPSAALAEYRDGKLSVLSHAQGIYPLRESMAEALGMAMQDVVITHGPGSGCYGHNGADDAAFEAALIARALPERPVLLKWTRQDEHRWEPVAPAMTVEVAADVSEGRIAAWSQTACSDTHRGRPRPGPDRAGPARFAAAHLLEKPESPYVATPNLGRHAGLHRNLDPVYDFDDKRLTKHLVKDLALRTSAMRCLGGAANIFAIESAMDEIAHQEGIAAIDLRRAHLNDPRALRALDAITESDHWLSPKAEGTGRGFAYAQYKNAMARVAVLVDVSVSDTGEARLSRALIIGDAGRVIDPDGLRAQFEGGFIQAASWALHEEVIYDRDGVNSEDWDTYPVIRFDGIPHIETVVLPYPEEEALGAGEASCGPTIAAIANAIHDATGLRLRKLPFRPDNILQAALSK